MKKKRLLRNLDTYWNNLANEGWQTAVCRRVLLTQFNYNYTALSETLLSNHYLKG